MTRILVFETEALVDEFVAEQLLTCVKKKRNPVLGFATGTTPCGAYDILIKRYKKRETDFKNVTAFNLDEYVGVAKNDSHSFSFFMRHNLFDKLNIPQKKIYGINGLADDLQAECLAYDELIDKHPIDIQLLGIGMDGHIAYNEPGSPFDGGSHVVDLHPKSIESSLDYGFDHIEEVPTQGITMGIGTIMKANCLLMIAKGEKKAALVKEMLEGEIRVDFPSTIIRRHHQAIVVLDTQAAKLLREEIYEKR